MQKASRHYALVDAVLFSVIDAIPESIAIIGMDGRIVNSNSRFAERYGTLQSECIGRNLFDLISINEAPELSLLMNAHCNEVLQTGQTVSFQERWQGRILKSRIDPLRLPEDDNPYLLIRIEDVSGTSVEDRNISDTGIDSDLVLKLSNTGVWKVDLGSGRFVWSETAWALYGLTPGNVDASMTLWASVIHPDDLETALQVMNSAIDEETGVELDFRVLLPDGSIRWCLARGIPYRDEVGRAQSLLGTVIDITDRKSAELEMAQYRHQLEVALEKSHIGVWDLNLSNHAVQRTLETARIFGNDEKGFGWNLQRFLSHVVPEDRDRINNSIWSAIREQKGYAFDCRIQQSGGEIRWIAVRGAFSMDERWGENHILGIVQDITERKMAESALSESEARFRSLFENHSAPMLIIDPLSGNIVDANPAASDFYGWSRDELSRMFIHEINTLPPDEIRRAMEWSRCSRQVQFRFRHLNADGFIRDVDVFSTRVMIGSKELLYSIIHDVTEKIRIEEKLKQREELFRSLFEDHCAVMIILDPATGNIVDANQAAAEFYGWSRDELRTKNITDINCAAPDFVRSDIRTWGPRQPSRYVVARHQRADGFVRHVEIFAKRVEVKGRVLIYDIIHDITERKRLEAIAALRVNLLEKVDTLTVPELLQASLDEIEAVTESSIGFWFLIARDQNQLSLQAVSTNTRNVMSAVAETLEHCLLDSSGVWADAIRERRPLIHNDYESLEHRKGLPEGHVRIVREMVVPVLRGEAVVAAIGIANKRFDYDDADVRWVSAVAEQVWDIIEKKTTEEEYRKIEERLHHTHKMELVGQLASGIAHEINNPLNFIQLNLVTQQEYFADFLRLLESYRDMARGTALQADGLSEKLQAMQQLENQLEFDTIIADIPKLFEESQRGFDRIKKIVEGMKSLSYRHDLDKKVFSDINQAVLDALTMSRGEYRHIADIETNLEEVPLVPCVMDQINQVLLNLIVNSSHAIQTQNRTEKGRICIRTWFHNGKVHCSVADDGPGIPEKIRSHVFNIFFTTKSAGKGTGLGLSIAYDIIVNKHNGEIFVHCPPEGGAVFTFSIPVVNYSKHEKTP
jgi:PAS domain S-box-containing protein